MSHSDAVHLSSLPPGLRHLAETLRGLDERDREIVIAAARGKRPLPTISWKEFAKTKGIAPLGETNAVLECDALYDDA